jgi:hypothetical protein
VCKAPGCTKRYTDPSSLRKHTKTFNHDSLIQQYERKCNEAIECDDVQQKIDTIYFDEKHHHQFAEQSSQDEIFYFNRKNSRTQWTDSDITVRIETIDLSEPLDLSIRNHS